MSKIEENPNSDINNEKLEQIINLIITLEKTNAKTEEFKEPEIIDKIIGYIQDTLQDD